MKRSTFVLTVIVACAVLGCLAITAAQTSEIAVSTFSGGPEQFSYGPTALRRAPDGTLWIVNPVDNSLTNVDRQGRLLKRLDLSKQATGISDVQIGSTGIKVLDIAADPPSVLTVSQEGEVLLRHVLPSSALSEGLNGFSAGENELDLHGVRTVSLSSPESSPVSKWNIEPGNEATPDGAITLDNTRIVVKADRGIVRGVRVLENLPKGIFILAEEVIEGDPLLVDATVRKYSHDGSLIGLARIPLASQATYVEHPVAITAEGEILFLATTGSGRAEIRSLPLVDSLPPLVPDDPGQKFLADITPLATGPCVSRSQMDTTAWSYVNNTTYYPQSALTGSCTGRGKPRHLGSTPRNYDSVAYDWGGFDSVSGYNTMIGSTYQAGDINTASSESCSRGVDCSGFVSRAWGLTSKHSTCTLVNVSSAISTQELQKGDILNSCGNHVVLFSNLLGNGLMAWESTVYNSYDRVVYMYSSWSRLSGYTARRYTNVCVDPTTPVHISSTASPNSGAPGTTFSVKSTWKNADNTPMTAWLTLRYPNGTTSDSVMSYVSGSTTGGALFQKDLSLSAPGRHDYAITTTSTVTGRSSRYPSSGFIAGPTVVSNPSSDFSISVSPVAISATQGSSGTTTVTTSRIGSFNSVISLTTAGLPSGATALLNPPSIQAPGSGTSLLTLSAGTATPGTFSITVTGSGGGKTHSTAISFTVTARNPQAPVITDFKLDRGIGQTEGPDVTLDNTVSPAGSAVQLMASENSNFAGAMWRPWGSGTTAKFTLSTGLGIKRVYLKVKSTAGIESAPASATIEVVRVPVITYFQINNGAAATANRSVTLNVTATNNPTQIFATEDFYAPRVYKPFSSAFPFTLSSSGYGQKTVWVWVRSGSGILQESRFALDTINLTAPPSPAPTPTPSPSIPVHLSSMAFPGVGAPGATFNFESTWKNADGTPMTSTVTIRYPNGSTSNYVMAYISGTTTSGALFRKSLPLTTLGRHDYAVTTTSTITGSVARFPSSGFNPGPTVANPAYSVSPNNTFVCGQSPVTIRVKGTVLNSSTVRFVTTKGDSSCGPNGTFQQSGVAEIREGSINGPIVGSTSFISGVTEVGIPIAPGFTNGSRTYYARVSSYWAGPVTVTVSPQ